MSRDAIFRYIDAHLDEHISKIQDLVRQPSVSLEREGLRECAELLRRHLAEEFDASCDAYGHEHGISSSIPWPSQSRRHRPESARRDAGVVSDGAHRAVIRSSLVDVLNQDYIRGARARGLEEWRRTRSRMRRCP